MAERLTPDQVRLRLERIRYHWGILETDACLAALIDLLEEVLPELVAEAQKKVDSGAQRYGGGVPGRMWQGRD